MAKSTSLAFARITAEVKAAALAVPLGRVTTYGAIGNHLQVTPRHVAFVMARLSPEESAEIPWHRVVGTGGKIRQPTAEELRHHRSRLLTEGLKVSADGKIADFEAVLFTWPERADGPGRPVRGPYSDPRTRPLFREALRFGYPPPDP
jgi:methylated-DNA-protein-cysteine methyltransferase-like protein